MPTTPADQSIGVAEPPELFAEHYAQAKLFYDSQTDVEKAHIAGAFRFELGKVTVPAIRERMVSSLRNASEELAAKVAEGLGMKLPKAMPTAVDDSVYFFRCLGTKSSISARTTPAAPPIHRPA